MDDQPYSNRELNEKFEHIEEHYQTIRESLSRIESQTTKTNGRVTKLESWRAWATGGAVIVVMLVIPLVVYAFNLATRSLPAVNNTTINK